MKFTALLCLALCFGLSGKCFAAEAPASWPAQVVAAPVAVQLIAEDPAARQWTWESAHFRIIGDLSLPLGIVRDLAAVFEATDAKCSSFSRISASSPAPTA